MSKWLTGWRIYPQIAERLRDSIQNGVYPAGTYLPSESALCEEFHVARNTLRRALEILEQEKLIAAVPAKGRIVLGDHRKALDQEHLYQSIAAELRERIALGNLPAGKVPSESTLTQQYATSRNTVRQALTELEAEGLIVARHGKGWFVRTHVSQDEGGRLDSG
ncbi:GntR family transcriptional regulator [Nonomuraea rhizosphaerae]|uniref:GntR family transcriptional regulator n=1 Tax=Nonomuraea rhizosphaerae TaxID=2665663 RepID=UPI0027E35E60|nr:GntR family transcriptional regulator [Nonomuraea rhizosphaerae]